MERATRIGMGLGGVAIASGITVLLGWWLDLAFLRAPIAQASPMSASTAVLCALAGGALVLLARRDGTAWRRGNGQVLAFLVVALALLMLIAHWLGFDGWIELLLIGRDRPRPALDTLVAMLLIGLALLLLDRTKRALAEILCLFAGAIALIVLSCYLYEFSSFADAFALGPDAGMAPNTAIALIALTTGALAVRADSGMMATLLSRHAGGTLARRLLFVALVVIPVLGFLAARIQDAGGFRPPGAAVFGMMVSLLVLFGALMMLARRLDLADIERTRAENELLKWKAFFDAASFGAVFGSVDDRLLGYNEAFARMHGYERDELVGRPIADVFSPSARPLLDGELRKIEERGHHRFESEHLRKDGSTFPVTVDATAVRDAQGRLLYRIAYVQDATEERAARAVQARLAALVDSAEDAIVLTDLEGKVVAWNRGAERVYGYASAEMIGKSTLALYPPERASERAHMIETMRAGQCLIGIESEHVRKDGSLVPIWMTTSPVRDADGWLIGISAISRDMTEKRAAERALAEAREEIERVQRSAMAVSEAIAQIPKTGLGHVLEVIAQEARGATDAEGAVVGLSTGPDQPFEDWAVSGASEKQVPLLLAAMRSIAPLKIAIRNFEPARRPEVPEVSGVHAIEPKLTSFLGVPIDFRGQALGSIYLANKPRAENFSERDQRMVEALAGHISPAIEIALLYQGQAIERARLQAILSQLPEGIIVLDAAGAVAHENAAALAFRQNQPERPYDVRWPNGDEVPLEELPLWRALRGETLVNVELSINAPSGERVPILVSAAPVTAETGPVGAVTVFRDIRALKELERLREEWASVIAHDLRQPLNVIRLGAELLLRGSLTDKQTVWTRRILDDATRLNRMVEDLLDLSRLEARRLELESESIAVEQVMSTAIMGLPELEGRTRIVIERGAHSVLGDANRVVQVLGNLLSNAVKYGTPGSEVRLEARPVGGQVRLSVTNHGQGVAQDEVPLLFERFTRTRDARKSAIQGVGLGLYICKGLVEAHGGRIWVESTPGNVTTFHFTLPAAKREEEVVESESQRNPATA